MNYKYGLLLIWFIGMAWIEMFGQTEGTKPEWHRVNDTLRVKLLVSYGGKGGYTREIPFVMNGYVVNLGGAPTPYRSEPTYLDDRKQPIKNLIVWQVKYVNK